MAIVPHIFFNNTLWTVLIFLINLALYFVPQLIIHPYDDKNFSYMVPITVFTVIFIIVRFFRLQVESYENKLNITNQKLGQDKLVIEQQRESLRALDEEKSAFFTNVTHEFRTPLTLIKGLAENLKPQVLNTEQRKELEVIEINAAKLSGMIDEILKLARTGKVDYSLLRSPVLMHAFFGKHADIFGVIAKKKGIGFQIETHPRNLTLLIDESKFDQIMTNLISNAIKFSPQGGAIYLKAFEHEKHIEIQIKDEGIGVAEQEQEMIFERFTSYAQTNHQTGTGIGLSLVKELVGLHHGEICVAPEHEKGTCFKLMLPRECLTAPVAGTAPVEDAAAVDAPMVARELADQRLRRLDNHELTASHGYWFIEPREPGQGVPAHSAVVALFQAWLLESSHTPAPVV